MLGTDMICMHFSQMHATTSEGYVSNNYLIVSKPIKLYCSILYSNDGLTQSFK